MAASARMGSGNEKPASGSAAGSLRQPADRLDLVHEGIERQPAQLGEERRIERLGDLDRAVLVDHRSGEDDRPPEVRSAAISASVASGGTSACRCPCCAGRRRRARAGSPRSRPSCHAEAEVLEDELVAWTSTEGAREQRIDLERRCGVAAATEHPTRLDVDDVPEDHGIGALGDRLERLEVLDFLDLGANRPRRQAHEQQSPPGTLVASPILPVAFPGRRLGPRDVPRNEVSAATS